ncbi:transposase [Bacillus sp. MUM 116]|uniref:transposase n=1 Tax=Bacillus sp. MUM 116 TaxID=1678002 RepID=UPI00210BAD54|nr:transposase [Bacillus sp. MUM 116]
MRFRYIFNLGVIVSAIIFGNIASLSIYEIIKDNTVFMTNIHSIFLNPFFLLTGGYLGIYILYRLIKLTIDDE